MGMRKKASEFLFFWRTSGNPFVALKASHGELAGGISDKVSAKVESKQPLARNELDSFYAINRHEKKVSRCLVAFINARFYCETALADKGEAFRRCVRQNETKLRVEYLELAEMLLMQNGLVYPAFEMHEKMIAQYAKTTRRYADMTSGEVMKTFWAIYLSGETARAFAWLDQWNCTEEEKKKLQRTTAFLHGEDAGDTMVGKSVFAQKIQGKKVAVMAPAAGKMDAQYINDYYDSVIQFNYNGRERLDANGVVLRCDVSYYNMESAQKLKNLTEAERNSIFKKLSHAVYKFEQYDYQTKQIQQGQARVILPVESWYWQSAGITFFLPMVLIDLLTFSPQLVTVFNSNLYLGEVSYYKGYAWNKQSLLGEWYSYAMHNLFSQFELMTLLHEKGIFQPDEKLAEILSQGKKEYAKQMDRLMVQKMRGEAIESKK